MTSRPKWPCPGKPTSSSAPACGGPGSGPTACAGTGLSPIGFLRSGANRAHSARRVGPELVAPRVHRPAGRRIHGAGTGPALHRGVRGPTALLRVAGPHERPGGCGRSRRRGLCHRSGAPPARTDRDGARTLGRGATAARVGEHLSPDARPSLARLGLWERFLAAGHLPCLGIRSSWGDADLQERAYLFDAYGLGWNLDRQRFDAMLADAVEAAGAALLRDVRIRSVEGGAAAGWRLVVEEAGRERRLTADVLVDATGRAAAIARRLGSRRIVYDELIGLVRWLPAGSPAVPPTALCWSRRPRTAGGTPLVCRRAACSGVHDGPRYRIEGEGPARSSLVGPRAGDALRLRADEVARVLPTGRRPFAPPIVSGSIRPSARAGSPWATRRRPSTRCRPGVSPGHWAPASRLRGQSTAISGGRSTRWRSTRSMSRRSSTPTS